MLIAAVCTHTVVHINMYIHTHKYRKNKYLIYFLFKNPSLYTNTSNSNPTPQRSFHVQKSLLRVRKLTPFTLTIFTYLFSVTDLPDYLAASSACHLRIYDLLLPALLALGDAATNIFIRHKGFFFCLPTFLNAEYQCQEVEIRSNGYVLSLFPTQHGTTL